MQRPYIIPVQAIGTSYEVSPGDFQIARLTIDNPSQCWLYLSGINSYVPPQTLSRVVSVNPTQSRIMVNFVDAPTGGVPSASTGGPVQVTVYEQDAPDVAGVDFGLLPAIIDLTDSIRDLILALAPLDILTVGTGYTTNAVGNVMDTSSILPAVVGMRYRLFGAHAAPSSAATGRIKVAIVIPSVRFGQMGLSTTGAGDHIQASSQGVRGSVNQPVNITYSSDLASQAFSIDVWYKLEAP